VTDGPRRAGIRVVLLDIEGTTTPVSFVYEVLFPYARAHVREWFAARDPSDPEVQRLVLGLRAEHGDAAAPVAASGTPLEAIVFSLMDQDRKTPALKDLQGRIWEDGYRRGVLQGVVYPDVPRALARWTGAGVQVAIYSSGSVLAQTLLFAHSTAGDLTPHLEWHFDTAVGAKRDPASYRTIADAISVPPSQILFVSDVVAELDAARASGMATRLCVRDAPPADAANPHGHAVITTFDELDLDTGT
jgi:enolase-phosphatase E1